MADYGFYTGTYLGNSVPEADFSRLALRAENQLAQYRRKYTVTGDETAENMAVCAMVDVLYYFEQTPQSLSIGGVSVTEREQKQNRELYRAACLYVDIYRGC